MQKNFLVAPSILSADFTRLGADLTACEAASADWIHVDVMDGRFVPNLTMGPVIVEACRRVTKLPLDVHLMIEQPERYIEAFAKAGASHITVHVETCPHLHRTLEQIKSLGCKAGVTLNPATPASAIEPVLPLADLVLVLTVNPGFSGQKFLPEVLLKIRPRGWRWTAALRPRHFHSLSVRARRFLCRVVSSSTIRRVLREGFKRYANALHPLVKQKSRRSTPRSLAGKRL
jgi:ribulose-phosphate 3-epimerase